MPMVDPFTPSAFTLTALTAAINNLPFQPQRLSGMFEESGIATLSAAIDVNDGVLSVVDVAPRGGPGKIVTGDGRRAIPFLIPHLPERANILADEVQGVRAFGSDNLAEVLQTRLNERLAQMRRNIDYTMEYHRAQSLMGNYVNANGEATSLFTAFGVTQQTQAMGFHASNHSAARGKAFLAIKMVKAALGGIPWTGLTALCGDDFWSALLGDLDTNATYLNQVQAAELRGTPTNSFLAYGINWEWYSGTSTVNFGSDAYLIPQGVPGLCITRFAPANYIETVNTIGLPYYSKSEPMDMGKGYEIEAQSNPLNLVTRPAAIVKLTHA